MSQFWTDCLTRFESELPAQQFNAWIKSLRMETAPDAGDGAELRLRLIAPNGFILKWVRDRYLDRVETLSRQFYKEPVTIDLVLDDTVAQSSGTSGNTLTNNLPTGVDSEMAAALPAALPAVVHPEDSPGYEKTRLNPEFTFDTLVTGRSNDLARAAAQQVAINPGASYNPLFIYGGVGLGKTHLIHALGNEVLRHAPKKVIRYIHAEDYFSDVVRAYQ
ncbi:MAG: DnaA/Hda family protein, partial [Rhodocyclaceae bacterium]|nr:DnaA/Hda family protein [Rhodocyclaceae bacterium]